MSSRSATHLIDPCALCPPATPGSDVQARALLELLYGRDARGWSRAVSALHHADDPDSAALARALADRLWLRPQLLFSASLPAAHWAGALDQLGAEHAGGAVIVVAPHAASAAAAACLRTLARARALSVRAPGVALLTLEARQA